MAFCQNCGTEVQGSFCPNCGKKVGSAGSTSQNTVDNYEIDTEIDDTPELSVTPFKAKIGVIVRLAIMVLACGYMFWETFRHMSDVNFLSILGGVMESLAFPGMIWLLVKVICLLLPAAMAIWRNFIPLNLFTTAIFFAISLVILVIPLSLLLNYAIVPFLDFVTAVGLILEIPVMLLLILLTACVAWVDICKFRGRSFL